MSEDMDTAKETSSDATFVARITPSQVHRDSGENGRYTRMTEALIEIEGAEPRRRTVMCFGAANAAITRRFVVGRPLSVSCTWRGGSLLVVGWPDRMEKAA